VARIDRVVTPGTFSLDGGTWNVDNNVWLVGDDDEVLVIDPAHDAHAVLAAVAGRRVVAVVCTHGHDDHINAAVEVAARAGCEVALHPDDTMLWEQHYGPDVRPGRALADGDVFDVAGARLTVHHTPGHSPGAVCLHVPELGVVFSGDTLFAGGPGATGRSYSDFDTIITSLRDRLLTLPPETVVHTGHGEDTSIGAEAPHLDEWVARRH
jgi:glyoxylase-like metal-dependent hydrolase (beta-lactamase superfamily II)